jgi:FkbM family methyltransferase
MKRYLLKSTIGTTLLSVRDNIELLHASIRTPEVVGTLANDFLAARLVTSICKPNGSFIDVGAHIGSIIAAVKSRTPTVKIIAIEAIPEKARALTSLFPDVEVHNCAVGEREGEAVFFVDTKRSGYSGLSDPRSRTGSPTVEIKVKIRRLDNLVDTADVDVVKIDVEGAELGVLRGSDGLLDRCRPIVMFESAPPSEDGLGYGKDELFSYLKARNYAVLIPNRVAHDGPPLTLEGFLESHFYPRRTTNYFGIPDERRTEVRDRARLIV